MANFTTNYNLQKPFPSEKVDVNVINQNMDVIDSNLKDISDKVNDNSDLKQTVKNHINDKSSNPHNITKNTIGLGNVENKSSATIRGELTSNNVINALGYTPPSSDTNTTYTISKSGTSIILKGSDDSVSSVTDNNTTYETGSSTTSGLTKLYTGTGSNTDGAMTQKAVTDELNKKGGNTFSNIKIGSTTISADSSNDTLTLVAGDNVTLTPDATNDKITISCASSSGSGGSSSGGGSSSSGNIVTWADGSWDDIASMLDRHYAGEIDISDYWAVGDTRTVSLSEIYKDSSKKVSAQDIELVIIGINHDDLVNQINGITKAAITVQMKNCSIDGYYSINYDNKNDSSLWSNSYMRMNTLSFYKSSLPLLLQTIIKKVIKYTWRYSPDLIDYRTQQNTEDDLFLLSEYEVFGTHLNTSNYGNAGNDGVQYDYYKTNLNRYKTRNGNNCNWWFRTSMIINYTSSGYLASFLCFNKTDGEKAYAPAASSGGDGLSFGFCL